MRFKRWLAEFGFEFSQSTVTLCATEQIGACCVLRIRAAPEGSSVRDGHTGGWSPEVDVALASPISGSPGGVAPRLTPAPKKRRKRRRNRKVFAREGASPAVSAPPAIETAIPPSAPKPVTHAPRLQNGLLGRYAHSPAFAALDLGTNNCRLLVAVPGRPGQFRVIDAFSRIVRLGEGLTASGRLSDAAMDRAVEALKICGDKLRNRSVKRSRLIATEACRSAANGAEFLRRVEKEAGLKLEIIDRRTEARLAVTGCGTLIERDTDGVVLFDIGGGIL